MLPLIPLPLAYYVFCIAHNYLENVLLISNIMFYPHPILSEFPLSLERRSVSCIKKKKERKKEKK